MLLKHYPSRASCCAQRRKPAGQRRTIALLWEERIGFSKIITSNRRLGYTQQRRW